MAARLDYPDWWSAWLQGEQPMCAEQEFRDGGLHDIYNRPAAMMRVAEGGGSGENLIDDPTDTGGDPQNHKLSIF